MTTNKQRAVIVGGGLAGLSAAAYLAKTGAEVLLLERAPNLGGRGATTRRGDWSMNLGPHALYVAGAAARAFAELGVEIPGRVPSTSGTYAVDGGRLRTLPVGFVSMLTTGLFGLGTKLELGGFLARAPKLAVDDLADTTASEWLEGLKHEPSRRFMKAMFRLTTYVADHDRMSAAVALRNLQLAIEANVTYVHGGWQTIVDALTEVARDHGAEIRAGARVDRIEQCGLGWRVHRSGEEHIEADAVVLAVAPRVAAKMAPSVSVLGRWSEATVPVRAACLDIALRALPNPKVKFTLGIDEPTYLSVHSVTADLAPEGGALVHVLRYLEGAPDPDRDRAELEAAMDRAQPGWRELVEHERFLPSMIVSHDLPRAGATRPGPAVPGAPGLFVAGDWVGDEGVNADASVASARAAAEAISVQGSQAVEERPVARVRTVVG